MEPPERVPWADLLAEYRQRNHKSGYKLEDPKRGLLHALCNQMGVVFNSTAAFLNDVQREQLLCKLVPEYVVEDPSMIFWFHCVGHHRRRNEIIMDSCRLKTENEEDFYRTSPYNRLLCVFHVDQACHINPGHLMLRLMADLGEEFIDTKKWAEWLASTNLTADTYFFLSEDEYGQIRDYVRREPSLPIPPPSDDAPAPPDIDPPGDSPEPPVQDPAPADPGTDSSERGSAMPDPVKDALAALTSAAGGAKGRDEKIKDATELLRTAANIVEDSLPGSKVVTTLDGKTVVGKSGDIKDQVRDLYTFLNSLPDDKFQMANDVDIFVTMAVYYLGDTDEVRSAAKSVFEKKGGS